MLAYVFWHWPTSAAMVGDYENHQRAFHAAMASNAPRGFLGSISQRIAGVPWIPEGRTVYEDWYWVKGFAELGDLNEGAVSTSRRASHDAVAALASSGTAGLYALRHGHPPHRPSMAYWFAKPQGSNYFDLSRELPPLVDAANGTLWMRQMVFGPAPEFCIQAPSPVRGLERFHPIAVELHSVWAAPAR